MHVEKDYDLGATLCACAVTRLMGAGSHDARIGVGCICLWVLVGQEARGITREIAQIPSAPARLKAVSVSK